MLLVLPQLALTLVFFYLPAAQAIWSSFTRADPFGVRTQFVGLENFTDLFADPLYLDTIGRSVVFCFCVAGLSMGLALVLALCADREIRGRGFYRVILILPYAIAPAIAAVLWVLLLHPQIGLIGRRLNLMGIHWDYKLDGFQAMLAVTLNAPFDWSQGDNAALDALCDPVDGAYSCVTQLSSMSASLFKAGAI